MSSVLLITSGKLYLHNEVERLGRDGFSSSVGDVLLTESRNAGRMEKLVNICHVRRLLAWTPLTEFAGRIKRLLEFKYMGSKQEKLKRDKNAKSGKYGKRMKELLLTSCVR